MHIKAFEVMMKAGKLPCNAKFMIEGERKWEVRISKFS